MHFAIIIGIVVGILVPIFFFHFLLIKSIGYNPVPTGEIDVGDEDIKIFAIKDGFVNFYVITDRKNYLSVDAGLGFGKSLDKFRQITIDPKKISHVFLTHAHPDHRGNVALLMNAEIHVNAEEKSRWVKAQLDSRNISTFKDGDNWKIGKIMIKAIATPGHTRGSTSYLINNSYLFTGDTLRIIKGKIKTSSRLIGIDMALQKQSITKLLQSEKFQFIFTAHTNYSNKIEQCVSSWFKSKQT